MRTAIRSLVVVIPAALFCLAPAQASLKSFKGPLVQERAANIKVEHSGIKITSYQFLRPLRSVQKLLKGDDPVIRLWVESENPEPQDVSFAVALYDGSGNLVGVASESRKVKAGEVYEVDLTFSDLNRYARHAKTMQVSVETHL